MEAIVYTAQAQKDLIGFLFVFKGRWVNRLNEVEVKIALWYSRRAFIRRTKKEVSLSGSLAFEPFEFMLPDPIPSHVRLIGALHDPFQGFVVIPVQLGCIETLRPLFDERIIVISLFKIQIILAVVWV